MVKNPAKSQMGIPDNIWNHPEMKEYRSQEIVFGYVGHYDRTAARDRRLMKVLKQLRFSDHEIVTFMTSTYGRHLGDTDMKQEDILAFVKPSIQMFQKEGLYTHHNL